MSESKVVRNHFADLFSGSSLPGIRFLAETYRPWYDRYLWMLLHLLACMISYAYIKDAYDVWQDYPVVLSLNSTLTHVTDIPLPAVTLCTGNIFRHDYDQHQTMKKCISCDDKTHICSYHCEDEELHTLISTLKLFRNRSLNVTDARIEQFLKERPFPNGTQIDSYIKEVVTHCEDDFFQISEPQYRDYPNSCYEVYTQLIDFQGTPVCMTYNNLLEEDIYEHNVVPATKVPKQPINDLSRRGHGITWTTETMVDFSGSTNTTPRYGRQIVLQFGASEFQLKIRPQLRRNNSILNSRIGIHLPGEVPLPENTRFHSFPEGRDMRLYVTPKLILAERSISHYDSSRRGCFFNNEKKLALFKIYNQKNCQLECRVNCSLTECGCVPYFLPRHNISVRVCMHRDEEKCGLEIPKQPKTKCPCLCLPECTSLSFDFEVDDSEPPDTDYRFYRSSIIISYKDAEFSSTVRYGTSSLSDFIADSGGLLGVFNGITFMAGFEILYFLTIRLWVTVKHSWSQDHLYYKKSV